MLTVIITNEILMLSRTIQKHIISPLSSTVHIWSPPTYTSPPLHSTFLNLKMKTPPHSSFTHVLHFNQQGLFQWMQMVEKSSQHPMSKMFAQYRVLSPVPIVHQLQSYIVLTSGSLMMQITMMLSWYVDYRF